MKRAIKITTLFLDIGCVLLTDGWSHGAGKLAGKAFGLSPEELQYRHNEALGTYELGKLTLQEYRHRDTFYYITVKRAGVEVAQPVCVIVDGKEQPGDTIQLVDDRQAHAIEIKVL